MKDYSKNAEQAKSFILGYDYAGDKIIVYYANGEMVVVENTKSVEKHLLGQMKEQVLSSVDAIVAEKESFKSRKKKTIGMGVAILGIIGICWFALPTGNMPLACGLSLFNGILAYIEYGVVLNLRRSKEKIADYEKNILLLKNETKLNETVKSNQNILAHVDNRVLSMVKNTPKDREVFTLNSIDKMSLGELKELLKAIKETEEFGVDESKTKTLGKRKGK